MQTLAPGSRRSPNREKKTPPTLAGPSLLEPGSAHLILMLAELEQREVPFSHTL